MADGEANAQELPEGLDAKIAVIKFRLGALDDWRDKFSAEILALYRTLNEKVDQALQGRPTWAVTWFLSAQMALIAVLATLLVSRYK